MNNKKLICFLLIVFLFLSIPIARAESFDDALTDASIIKTQKTVYGPVYSKYTINQQQLSQDLFLNDQKIIGEIRDFCADEYTLVFSLKDQVFRYNFQSKTSELLYENLILRDMIFYNDYLYAVDDSRGLSQLIVLSDDGEKHIKTNYVNVNSFSISHQGLAVDMRLSPEEINQLNSNTIYVSSSTAVYEANVNNSSKKALETLADETNSITVYSRQKTNEPILYGVATVSEIEPAMFFQDTLNINSSYGKHSQTTSAGTTFAYDFIGGGKHDRIKAPFNATIIKCEKSANYAHDVWIQSNNIVRYADNSTGYMTILFAHDDNIDDIETCQPLTCKQPFYDIGNFGNSNGNHVHVEIQRGKWSGHWNIGNTEPNDALWLYPTTNPSNPGNLYWRTWTGTLPEDCTKHIKGEFLFCEALHPHYNYYSCTKCGTKFTDNSTTYVATCNTCVNPPSCSQHIKGQFLFSEELHPHYNYFSCANCGVKFTDNTTTNQVSCPTCSIVPAKPKPKSDKAYYSINDTIYITWPKVSGATKYTYYISQYPEEFAYQTYEQNGTITEPSISFPASQLGPGRHRMLVHAFGTYNQSERSDWVTFDIYETDYIPRKTIIKNNHIYALYDYTMAYDFAEKICGEMGGHLATITSAEENSTIVELLDYGDADSYWLGAKNNYGSTYNDNNLPFAWCTGEPFSYTNWAAGEPSHSGTNATSEHFMEIRKSYGYKWNDVKNVHTATSKGFILEIDIANLSPAASTTYGKNYYIRFDQTMPWTEAQAFCESIGGHLVTISSKEEDEAITDLLKNDSGTPIWYYIGANNSSGSWKWVDNSIVPTSNSVANWSDIYGTVLNRPTGWGGFLMKYRAYGTWIGINNFYYPGNNSSLMGFVCEIDQAVVTATFDPTGGTILNTENQYVYGQEYGELPIPTKKGYTFIGWFTKKDGGTPVTNTTVLSNRFDHTLYAHWYNNCDSRGHHYFYDVIQSPSITYPGALYRTCLQCELATTIDLPKLNLSDYDYEEIKQATCTTTGKGRYTWRDRYYGLYQFDIEIAALEHQKSEEIIILPATCAKDGIGKKICTLCQTDLETDILIPATGEHVAGELIVDVPATCMTAGIGHKACTACGETAEENIAIEKDADNHTGTTFVKNATAATCGDKGYSGDTVCECGATITKGKEIPVTGKHSWDNGKVTKEPTTTKEGVKTFACTVCSATKTEKIAKLPAEDKEEPKPTVSFKDVKKSDFFYTPVQWAVANGVTTGTSKTTFGPEESCIRAQAVTFLWRAAGQPTVKNAKNPFADVKKSDYYYKAVLWAAESGVTSGTSATKFSPNDVCTRGQIVTFLWRAQSGKKVSASNPFKDVKKSDFYYNAVLWAVKNGVTTGTSKTTFGPSENCTRGQIVTFLYRAVAK